MSGMWCWQRLNTPYRIPQGASLLAACHIQSTGVCGWQIEIAKARSTISIAIAANRQQQHA